MNDIVRNISSGSKTLFSTHICRVKIALIHHRLANVGGLESRMRNYLDFFTSRGHQVTLFCYKQHEDFHIPNGTTVKRVDIGWAPKHLRRFAFNKKLQKVFRKEDFDFSLSMERTSGQHASIAPGDHIGFMKALGINGWRPKHKVQVKMDEACFESSHVIFPCSDLIRQNLVDYYKIPNEKLLTLLPPLNPERFNLDIRANRDEYQNQFGVSREKVTLGMVSVSHKRKGVPLALKIMRHLPEEKYELKIAGHPKLKTDLANVEFLGYVPNTTEFYSAIDFVIHPALFEPAGQLVAESLACGTPVVVSEKTGWGPHIQPDWGAVVRGFEPEKWALEIEKITEQTFRIPRNFAEMMGLTLDQHVEAMINFFEKQTGERLNL